jgi:putative RecB family exonuclease
MTTYSHSRLSTFEQCRQKYKFRYVDGIKVPGQSVEAFLGSRVHEVMERLYEDVRHRKIPELGELLDFYRQRWEAEWSDDVRIQRKEYTEENYFDMGAGFVGDYYARHRPFDDGRTLGLETQDLLDLGDGNRFHVRIDRLIDEGGGTFSVNDYKTAKNLPGQDYHDADRQLAFYSIWVRERFPEAKRVRLVWHYLAHDRHVVSERTPEQLEDLKGHVRAVIGEIESCRVFGPSVSTLCDWCEYREMCPAWEHESRVSKLSEREFHVDDGVRMVNLLSELTEQEKELSGKITAVKKDLIAYSRQHGFGAVVGEKARATIRESDSVTVPKKGSPERRELEERLRIMGLYDGLLTLDAPAVKKLDEGTREKLGLKKEARCQVFLGKRKGQ